MTFTVTFILVKSVDELMVLIESLYLPAETPLTAPEGVWFMDKSYENEVVESFDIQWLAGNLTQRSDATVTISLWGYRERTITPEIIYIDTIVVS